MGRRIAGEIGSDEIELKPDGRTPTSFGKRTDGSAQGRLRRLVRRWLPFCCVLYVALVLFPIRVPVTRLAILGGAAGLWCCALLIWWSRRRVRIALLVVMAIPLVLVALPGRPIDSAALRADYSGALGIYSHARYVWGGETIVGVDCSGLVRQGLVVGELWNGIRTLNGTPIRRAVSLWWNDATADDLLRGANGRTQEIGRYDSINEIDLDLVTVGDMAATTDGVHILVYRGDEQWVEADPLLGRVVEVQVPSAIVWFETPVVLLRWTDIAWTS